MNFQGYTSERALVAAASVDAAAKEKLRAFVEPGVRDAVRGYLAKWSGDPALENALVSSGMSAFDHALAIYLKDDMNLSKPEGHFPLYFAWWARQAAFKTFQALSK